MAEAKANAARGGGWVSTNDVLTSHFGLATGARALMFTFSYRNRISPTFVTLTPATLRVPSCSIL